MPAARRTVLVNIAAAVQADRRLFDPHSDLAQAIRALRQIGGIGEWTGQYIAMRALGESDAFLTGDVALQRRLANLGLRCSPKELLARAEHWRALASLRHAARVGGPVRSTANFSSKENSRCTYGLIVTLHHCPFCW